MLFSSQRIPSEGVPSSLPTTASPMTDMPPPMGTHSKKKPPRKSTAQRVSEREFTRQDKADQLLNAVEKIIENNNLLREKCRCVHTHEGHGEVQSLRS